MSDKRTSRSVQTVQKRTGFFGSASRMVPEEVPIAFSYGGTTHAVMMASPADIEDFAYGFSLAEGIIREAGDILAVEPHEAGGGIDVQVELRDANADALTARRRRMAGPVGCGLCGIESIEQATRSVEPIGSPSLILSPRQVAEAVQMLSDLQVLNRQTRAVHGAAFYIPGDGLVAVREDVGRHNALDKLSGAVLRQGRSGHDGAVVVTSRLSVEMVQKTAALGSPILLAISAPTALAIETAETAGITLVGIVRGEEFEIFTRADRISEGASAHVA
ncbi:formate dehydrogenase accessory sulfurtransferase FdhD [Ciceribacter sp. L1K22]|uniref:formate dehydrogenase accessory sulfurtransferase FdhD n=1 Tax=Ciceribacter sp. L1K22 TaxID=2820275 RepID=UPI001ABEE4DA|nr:formate dehydrogenase accessory sulfurtransferase FdhD [Ciceribacter sp. L1K22]